MAEEHHKKSSHEYETDVVDHGRQDDAVESKGRGLFDFLGKKKEEKPQEEVIDTEFEEKAAVSDVPEPKLEQEEYEEKKHSLLGQFRRSDNTSGPSSEEKEKKGLTDKIKDRITGDRKEEKHEDTSVPIEKYNLLLKKIEKYELGGDAPAGHHPSAEPVQSEENKGVLAKIKEKLPGQQKKTEEVHPPPPRAEYAAEPPSREFEVAAVDQHHSVESIQSGERKNFLDEIKERVPSQLKHTEEVHPPPPQAEYVEAIERPSRESGGVAAAGHDRSAEPVQHEEKKGFLDKIEEKLPVQQKKTEEVRPPPPQAEYVEAIQPPRRELEGVAGAAYRHSAEPAQHEEKKGFLDKIEGKLPVQLKKTEEVYPPPPQAEYAEAPQPPSRELEGVAGGYQHSAEPVHQKKDFLNKIKEKLPTQQEKTEEVYPPTPREEYAEAAQPPSHELGGVTAAGYHHSTEPVHEKEDFLGKIKEKLPVQQKKTEEVYPTPPQAEYAETAEPPRRELGGVAGAGRHHSAEPVQPEEKTDFIDTIKEKLPGQQKKTEEVHPPPPQAEYVDGAEQPSHELEEVAATGRHHSVEPIQPEEKKSFLGKMKEKLPGQHKKTEDVHPPPPQEYVDAAEQPGYEGEAKEKKGILEKIKEKLPGYHAKTEEYKEKESASN